jgi:hypothetical protein
MVTVQYHSLGSSYSGVSLHSYSAAPVLRVQCDQWRILQGSHDIQVTRYFHDTFYSVVSMLKLQRISPWNILQCSPTLILQCIYMVHVEVTVCSHGIFYNAVPMLRLQCVPVVNFAEQCQCVGCRVFPGYILQCSHISLVIGGNPINSWHIYI